MRPDYQKDKKGNQNERIASCSRFSRKPVTYYSRMDNEPMSVVSFKTKQVVNPYWILQQLAAIDAALIFKFANSVACTKYDVPAERKPRADYLCELLNGASDDFRLEYLNEIWDLLGLPRGNVPVNVSEIRTPLYPIFAGEFPNGYAAGACFNFVRESLDMIPGIVEFGSPQHLQRIELEAIRDRISRIEQDQDAN
jgi:hypothetical protein